MLIAALVAAFVTVALASSAEADPSEYGLSSLAASTSTNQAGDHPDFETAIAVKTINEEGVEPIARTQRVVVSLPPGLLANPSAIPTCTAAQLVGTDLEDPSNATGCPQDSQVGVSRITVLRNGASLPLTEPVFNLVPRYGEPARFGFIASTFPVLIGAELHPDGSARGIVEGISALVPLLSADTLLWGVPADPVHDTERITAYEGGRGGVPDTPTGTRSSSLVPVPFMHNPTSCGSEREVSVEATPYPLPDLVSTLTAQMGPGTGCALLDFEPDLQIAPTTSQAESGAGLDVELKFPTDGLEHPNLLGGAIQKRAEVPLPEGVTVNPSQAVGLGVCSEADFAREDFDTAPDEGCPESAKIGTVSATSPLVKESAEGGLFIAKPKANPFNTLIALYMVLKIPERGVIVKLAGKVEPDPTTGQLVTTFGEAPYEIPQLPVSSFHLHFREGARSPLVTPPRCGTYASDATFTSWDGQTLTTHPSFRIDSGVGHGPCPQGPSPFEPGFEAGTLSNAAGSFSEFDMRLTRKDGDQDLTRFSAKLPPGALAKLAGVAQCPDAAIAAAGARDGKDEQAAPSCPANSEIGSLLAGAGVGQVLTYATGKLYLAGPYQGAPASVAAIVPAVAGPFDVGTVVTREALRIDPRSGEVEADGSSSDPIPHILAGIPLKVRDVRVNVDRPSFTLNPTSCDPFATVATLWSGGEDVFSSADDTPHSRSARFQAADCAHLGFKPRLGLRLKGGTRRGAFPALRLAYAPRPGHANLRRLVLRFPSSEFIEQGHFRTICTRVQFAAGAGFGSQCPKGAVYGRVKVFTPLLDAPLTGRVLLRSSDHNLPDAVLALEGPPSLPIRFEVANRIDSVKGGLRVVATGLPDAPISRAIVQMQGGQKGLFVNSTNICRGAHRARIPLLAQSGRRAVLKPKLRAQCGKAKRKARRASLSRARVAARAGSRR